MNLLLDTHVLLWWLADSPQLDARHREAIADRRNGVWVSAASLWEIGIKMKLGKLEGRGDLLEVLGRSGFQQLEIGWKHAEAAPRLPDHHRDPFDRMLVAQSITERLTLVTADSMADHYPVTTL